MASETIPDALLARYLGRECTAEEAAAVERWAGASRNARRLAAMRHAWDRSRPTDAVVADVETDEFIVRWRAAVDEAGADAIGRRELRMGSPGARTEWDEPRLGAAPSRTWWLRAGWRWGIAVAAACVITLVRLSGGLGDTAGSTSLHRAYATTTGQRATLMLSDGTRVTLAPRSVLRVPAGFGTRSRVVWLDGAGYFEVTQARSTPFVVEAGGVSARVLGTAFVVRHYTGDARVRVAVRTGKVAVAGAALGRTRTTLVAGRAAEVGDSSITPLATGERDTGWLDGRLVFHQTPMREVLDELGRWYGYQFRLADSSLAGQRLTAALSAQSSALALSTIKLLLGVDMTFDGDLVTLIPRRGGGPRAMERDAAREQLTTHNGVGR